MTDTAQEKMPQAVSESADAAECWLTVYPQVTNSGPVTATRTNALTRYCLLWAQWKTTMANLEKWGSVFPIKDDKGKVVNYKDRPEVARSTRLSSELSRLEGSLGMHNRQRESRPDEDAQLQAWRKQRASERARKA